MSRKSAPIKVVLHYPKTTDGRYELTKRVAGVHADLVNQYIQSLSISCAEKNDLLNAVIENAR